MTIEWDDEDARELGSRHYDVKRTLKEDESAFVVVQMTGSSMYDYIFDTFEDAEEFVEMEEFKAMIISIQNVDGKTEVKSFDRT